MSVSIPLRQAIAAGAEFTIEVFRHLGWLLLWPLRPRPRNVLAWIIALITGANYVATAWWEHGHITCDFCSQWLMGRMLARGEGHNLYLVSAEQEALKSGYEGKGYRDDAYEEMNVDILEKGRWSKGREVEGPLYPPTMALLMWPFGTLDPQPAHTLLVVIYVQLGFVSAWLLRDITRGRIKMGEAALLVIAFPNYAQAILLGQNSSLTLVIVAGGWALWSRQRFLWAGVVWGLLAYKPVFALALIWVPLVLCNWRMFLGMVVTGAAFCIATLPFCLPPDQRHLFEWSEDRGRWEWTPKVFEAGTLFEVVRNEKQQRWEWTPAKPWYRWYDVGKHAAYIYEHDPNWVWMSRDLLSLPRRAMWDREHLRSHAEYILRHYLGYVVDDSHLSHLQGWDGDVLRAVQAGEKQTKIGVGLIAGVAGFTIIIVGGSSLLRWWRGRPVWPTGFGPRAAFLLFGALMTCYHFIHYDLLVFALPAALLAAGAGRMTWWGRSVLIALGLATLWCSYDLAAGLHSIRIPFEIFLLLFTWAWCGVLTVIGRGDAGASLPVREESAFLDGRTPRLLCPVSSVSS